MATIDDDSHWRPERPDVIPDAVRAWLRTLFEGSPAAVVVRDLDGGYHYANGRALRHARARNLEGTSLADIYSPARADEINAIDRDVADTGRPLISEGRFITPVGDEHTILIAATPPSLPRAVR